ncbi:MAG: ABC transporter permease [Oscillospiraceae bacterium]|nr:ABC transporter permease [Oscillospiraceae bacterium]
MIRYILKRIAWLILVLLAVSFIVFAVMYNLAGSNLDFLSYGEPVGALAKVLAAIGLYDTFLGDFFLFLLKYVIQLDFAQLLSANPSNVSALPTRIKYTLLLCMGAVILSWIIGMPLGIAAATHKGGKLDTGITSVTVALGSMPTFWTGLMLLLIFAGFLRMVSTLFKGPQSLILPIISLTLSNIPIVTAATRAGLVETFDKDFILTVRSKGLPERAVIWSHAVRNSILPLLSILSSQLTKAFGGALVLEMVFSVPGLGMMLFNSISTRDFPLLMVCILLAATFSGLISVIADAIYAAVNPAVRQRYE